MEADTKSSAQQQQQEFSPELLRMFYARLFPYAQMFRWLSYGNDPDSDSPGLIKDYFGRREFSFTIGEDIYIRYQSFRDRAEMEAAIQRKQPHKIDIGAVFTHPPKDHHTVKADTFKPVERELIFDIDMSDYNDIRTCCDGAKICHKCWPLMTMATKVLDTALRDDFGFKNIMWVYSGRRGIHCWVCDDNARALANDGRSAVVEYLSILKGNENSQKRMTLTWPLHPSLTRAFDILEPMFERFMASERGQGVLESENKWEAVVDTIPDEEVQSKLRKELPRLAGPSDRWEAMKAAVAQLAGRNGGNRAAQMAKKPKGAKGGSTLELWKYETVFKYCYPRLDVNVSKGLNHLLKSPFAIHPKTGRVCVPIDPVECDSFDPFRVPTVRGLMAQIDKFDMKHDAETAKSTPDYKKTELRDSIELFERVLCDPIAAQLKRRFRDERDRLAALTGDF